MPRTLGWALQSSCKMVLVFILGSKCNFCFSCSLTLVSWYLDASVEKPASHHFPGNKFVVEEGLSWWSWQPSPALDFPLGCAQWRHAGWAAWGQEFRQVPPPGVHPGLARIQLCLRHCPAGYASAPVTGVTRSGFHNHAGRALGALPSTPPGSWLSPGLCSTLTSLSRSWEARNSGWEALGAAGHTKLEALFWASWWCFGLFVPSAATLTSGHQAASG